MARSEKAFDEWSIGHFLGGALVGAVVRKPLPALAIILGWEVFEQGVLAQIDPWWSEGPANTTFDVVLGFAGAMLMTDGFRAPDVAVAL